LPDAPFEPYGRAAGYFVSREAVEPIEVAELGDLLARHAEAGIELRIVPDLHSLWERVIASTLEFSGIRLRNLARRTGSGSGRRARARRSPGRRARSPRPGRAGSWRPPARRPGRRPTARQPPRSPAPPLRRTRRRGCGSARSP